MQVYCTYKALICIIIKKMRELTKIVEMISSEMESDKISKIYFEGLMINNLYKAHLEISFKKLIDKYREQNIGEMCRVFIIHIETILNYHVGENLETYKKLTLKYKGQTLEKKEFYMFNLNTIHLPSRDPINHIDHNILSFKKKYLLFTIFNFADSKNFFVEIFDCYEVRNYLSHGYLNPKLSKRPKRNQIKKLQQILSEDINDRFLKILATLEFYNHVLNKKNQLKELLEVDSNEIINNKNLLVNILEKSNKKFTIKFEKIYKKLIKKEFNRQIKEKMEKSITEILKYSANENSYKFIDPKEIGEDILEEINLDSGMVDPKEIGEDVLEEINFISGIVDTKEIGEDVLEEINLDSGMVDPKDIGEDILEEINLDSGMIDPKDIGEDILEEINLDSGMVDTKGIGNDILKKIDHHSGVINSNEVDKILNTINENSDKIEPDDLIDILYEIEKRNNLSN